MWDGNVFRYNRPGQPREMVSYDDAEAVSGFCFWQRATNVYDHNLEEDIRWKLF